MKRFSAISLLLLIPLLLMGQEKRPRNLPAYDFKRLHWGFTVGLNVMDFGLVRQTTEGDLYGDVKPLPGFQVNVVSDLRLTDYWTLRFLPGINLGDRAFYFYERSGSTLTPIEPDDPEGENTGDRLWTQGSAYLDFPLLLKYRSERVNNYRPYVVGGVSYRLDMSPRKSNDAAKFGLNRHDAYIELGFGVDTYLQYFKFSPEIKICVGMLNMLNENDFLDSEPRYVESVSSLRSFLVMINFHFE